MTDEENIKNMPFVKGLWAWETIGIAYAHQLFPGVFCQCECHNSPDHIHHYCDNEGYCSDTPFGEQNKKEEECNEIR